MASGAVAEAHGAHPISRGLLCLLQPRLPSGHKPSSGSRIVSRSDVCASSTTPPLAMEMLEPHVLEVSDGYMLDQDHQTHIRLYSSEK